METSSWLFALAGGALLGVASSVLLAVDGRTEGVSGMAANAFRGTPTDRTARVAFLAGLASTGLACRVVFPGAFAVDAPRSLAILAVAGLLIGYGARLANGCTSGHGILGVSRLSARGLVAVTIFSVTAAATVALVPLQVTP
jgi:uncharacterized protein